MVKQAEPISEVAEVAAHIHQNRKAGAQAAQV
jgi:hypothetical protein